MARGELSADVDANLIIETLIGPLYVRLLFTGEPIDDRIADQVARIVSAGAASAHDARTRPRSPACLRTRAD